MSRSTGRDGLSGACSEQGALGIFAKKQGCAACRVEALEPITTGHYNFPRSLLDVSGATAPSKENKMNLERIQCQVPARLRTNPPNLTNSGGQGSPATGLGSCKQPAARGPGKSSIFHSSSALPAICRRISEVQACSRRRWPRKSHTLPSSEAHQYHGAEVAVRSRVAVE